MKTIRRLLLCLSLLAVLGVTTVVPAARADDTPITQDDTRFWQVMEAPTPPTPNPAASDAQYWQEVQLQQDYQQLHQ